MARLGHELKNCVQVCGIRTAKINERVKEGRIILSVALDQNIIRTVVINQVLDITRVVHVNALGSFTRLDPVNISKEGINLSIVSHNAHRLCKGPTRASVGRETTMVDCKFSCEIRVLQIFVELRKNASLHHALVYYGSGRE
jgi:hypothetical protein